MDKLIVANWKSNPATIKEAGALAAAVDASGLVIAPPAPFIEAVGKSVKNAELGAQDLFWEDGGPYTGQVSGSQLGSLDVKYVIVGHSERRRLGDTDTVVAKKVSAALRNGIIPIICIGETREERTAGKSKEAVERQLKFVLPIIHDSKFMIQGIVFAYEPVWAISTEPGAEPDTPQNALQMIQFIKAIIHDSKFMIQSKFIYGGSVNAANAESFLGQKDIEGALVGGASLKKEEIKKIIEIAKKY